MFFKNRTLLLFFSFIFIMLVCKSFGSGRFDKQVFIFNIYLIIITLPFIYFSIKNIFSNRIATYFLIIFSILLSFPHWLFLGHNSTVFFVEKQIVFGMNYKIILLLFLSAPLLFKRFRSYLSFFFLKFKKRFLFYPINRIPNFVILIFLLSMVQMFFRFGNYNPYGEIHIPIDHPFVSQDFPGFFDVRYASCDANHHFLPASIYVTDQLNHQLSLLVVNDRPTIAYLFHAVSPFFHPYIAARLILFLFYLLIVFSFYKLVLNLDFSEKAAFSAVLVFMSSHYLLKNATVLDAYIHAYNYAPILLLSFSKYLKSDNRFNSERLLNLVFIASFIGLGYFPFSVMFNVMFFGFFLLLFGLLSKSKLVELLFVFVTIFVVKKIFVYFLFQFGLEGDPDNRSIGAHYLGSLPKLLDYSFREYLGLLGMVFGNLTIILRNYMNGEYFVIYGVLGYLGILLFTFRSKSIVWKSNITLFLSFIIFNLVTSIPASLWPHQVWSKNLPLTLHRSIGSQYIISIGLFYFIWYFSKRWKNGERFLLFSCSAIYLLSFAKIGWVWIQFHEKYPMFERGFSSFGW